MQASFDKSLSIIAHHQFACREIFLKGEMQEAVAFLAPLNQDTRLPSDSLQKSFRQLISFLFIFGYSAINELFHDLRQKFVFRDSTHSGMFVHPESQRAENFK